MIYDMETYVKNMKGRPYPDIERELTADGFARGRMFTVRETGGRKVRFVRGRHENAVVVDLEHKWVVDHYGIGRPGSVTSGNIVETGARNDCNRGV